MLCVSSAGSSCGEPAHPLGNLLPTKPGLLLLDEASDLTQKTPRPSFETHPRASKQAGGLAGFEYARETFNDPSLHPKTCLEDCIASWVRVSFRATGESRIEISLRKGHGS